VPSVKRTLLAAWVVVAAAGLHAQGGAGDEQRLKAAFVFRFPQFVTWPTTAVSGRETLDICVAGSEGTARALRDLTSGESLNGLRLLVRENPVEQNLASCHVLVLPGPRPDRDLIKRAAAKAILTVGESPTFLDEGGIIQLKVIDRRVRFEISLPAAERAGVTLSSQLLRLAAAVREQR
jgi:hypothetical protein